MVLNIPQVYLV